MNSRGVQFSPEKKQSNTIERENLDKAKKRVLITNQEANAQIQKMPAKKATEPISEKKLPRRIKHRYSYRVRGNKYQVFKSPINFQEVGVASWYGPGFHGKTTANGERYDMLAMTAAHKTLPLGTRVRVTNLENGLQVMVRINDRGPFHRGRIIDLSKKAAQKLGLFRKGQARVHLKTVEEN